MNFSHYLLLWVLVGLDFVVFFVGYAGYADKKKDSWEQTHTPTTFPPKQTSRNTAWLTIKYYFLQFISHRIHGMYGTFTYIYY